MPKIDVDNEVFGYLEKNAVGFDTPNKVLRRLLGIEFNPNTLGSLHRAVMGLPVPDSSVNEAITAGLSGAPPSGATTLGNLMKEATSQRNIINEGLSCDPGVKVISKGGGLSRLLENSQRDDSLTMGALSSLMRTKQRKTKLSELVEAEILVPGELLHFQDYRRKVYRNIVATVEGDLLKFNGQLLSMSQATRQVMEKMGNFENRSFRGPDFWVTAEMISIRSLWDNYLEGQGTLTKPDDDVE